MSVAKRIIGIGEALYDVFPDGSRLGGAPLNMALHAHQLGNVGVVITRIGQDPLGDKILAELQAHGMPIDHIQTDPDHPTGTVIVDFDERGEPNYNIVKDVAWDMLWYDFDLTDAAQVADAVCYGSLAQRTGQSRNTLYRFLDEAKRAVRLFDVNLRQDYYDRRILTRSCELATAVKLNHEELAALRDMFDLAADEAEAARGLMKKFDLKWMAVTHGEKGTAVHTPQQSYAGAAVPAPDGGNPVGAGDATAAALLHGATRRWDWPRTLQLANTLGSFVASQDGACPKLPDEIKKLAE